MQAHLYRLRRNLLSGFASQAGVWTSASERTRRNKRAETRLAQPIPVVEGTNDVPSSSVGNDRRRTEIGATTRSRRIQWTEDLDADFVRCNDAITLPRGSGRQRELIRCWLALHPLLPASGPALSTRLCRIRQLGVVRPPVRTTRSPGSDWDSSDSSTTTASRDSGQPEGNTRSTTRSVGAAAVSGSI